MCHILGVKLGGTNTLFNNCVSIRYFGVRSLSDPFSRNKFLKFL